MLVKEAKSRIDQFKITYFYKYVRRYERLTSAQGAKSNRVTRDHINPIIAVYPETKQPITARTTCNMSNYLSLWTDMGKYTSKKGNSNIHCRPIHWNIFSLERDLVSGYITCNLVMSWH